MPWDIAGAFNSGAEGAQKVQQGSVDAQGQAAAGRALQAFFQQGVPGAQPMPQQGQPPQQQGPLAGLRGLLSQPQQNPGAGGQPGMPQPMQAPQQRPPMQSPVPGAQPMGQPQGPPQAGAPPPMQPPQGGGVQNNQPFGGLDWKHIVQQVVQANPGVKDPRVLMSAVNQFLPVMNQQAQMEWKQVMAQAAQTRAGAYQEGVEQRPGLVAEQQAGADRRVGMQQAGAGDRAQLNANTREDIAGKQIVSRETIAKMNVNEREEAYKAGIVSREQVDEANRNERAREHDEAETGRNTRATLAADTKTTLSKLSIQARKEIEAAKLQVEGIKEDNRNLRARAAIEERDRIAKLSANTREEIAKLNADERKSVTEYLEKGRQDRSQAGISSRESEGSANRASREGVADKAETGRQGRFDQKEQRLEHATAVRQDQGWQSLSLRAQALQNQIQKTGDQRLIQQWRATVDAQHKRAQEIISSAATGGQPMDPDERKRLMKEEDQFYTNQIKQMRSGGAKPVQVKTPEDAQKLEPGTSYSTPDGQTFTR